MNFRSNTMPVSLTNAGAEAGLLYPRLPREVGRAILQDLSDDAMILRSQGALDHASAAPAPTGGIPASAERIERIQTSIRRVADVAGFPSPLRRGSEQIFDRPCGTELYKTMSIVPADAAAEDVWTFLTLVVVPEIGPWRFPGRNEERLLGRPRNVLRRLWWRAWSLGPDLDEAPLGATPFGEDEFVGIMERASIGGNPTIARAVRDAVWRVEIAGSRLSRSEIARETTRRFRAFMSHVCVDALAPQELEALLDEVTDVAVHAVEARLSKA